MDRMKTAQLFRKKVSAKILIFVSSSREYVFEAYDVEAFQYLLKPVEDRKLKNVLQKAVLKTERRSQEFIIVSSQRQKKKLFLDDIYYFEIKGRIVDAHGLEGIFTYYEQMGELENKLQDKGFFRCHKSYLVNPFSAFLYPVFFIGLVVVLFQSDREKRIVAASVLMLVFAIFEGLIFYMLRAV